jgi:hypothetical protein
MSDLREMAEGLRWIKSIADKEHERDRTLRARGARTLRRIAEKAEHTLEKVGELYDDKPNTPSN